MPRRVARVRPEPTDLAARFNLDGSVVVIENVGIHPLWFLPAAIAGEAAPADRVGHLLRSGRRQEVQPRGGAGWPLWVWSSHPTAVAVGPRLDG